jgi:hypothetical protein
MRKPARAFGRVKFRVLDSTSELEHIIAFDEPDRRL